MTREGAVEVNAATGRKKRISNRIRDADLTRKEAAPQQPGQAAQTIPGGAASAPAADTPPLPHAPGAEREQDTAASGGRRREGDDVRARAADGKGQLLLQPAIVLHQLPRAARRVRLRAHASAPPFVSAAGT